MSEAYDVSPTVLWKQCHEENSYYFSILDLVILCTDMEKHPQAAVFFAAHETAHAITWRYAKMMDEGSADEVAAISLIELGRRNDVRATSTYFRLEKEHSFDAHPTNVYRAWELDCLVDGFESINGSSDCAALYRSTRLRWLHRLKH